MKFNIVNRFSGKVQFEAEIDCNEGAHQGMKIGLAVKWGIENNANLRGANLRGAYLRGANLRGANLSDANLSGANLSGANLSGANLRGAYLRGANLRGANLSGANLSGANLRGAYLSDAYLRGANLSDAYLRGANLSDAYLSGANLSGANLRGANCGAGIPLTKAPIQISGLTYKVDILDRHIKIGCEVHTIDDWESFDDEKISAMEGDKAIGFWSEWKGVMISIARKHEVKEAPEAPEEEIEAE